MLPHSVVLSSSWSIPWRSRLGYFWFSPTRVLPVTFYLVTFRLTAPTVVCFVMCMIWCRDMWVFLCGISLASNLNALCCVTHRGPCLHTSDAAWGTGLSEQLHNWCWLCLELFKQLLVFFLPADSSSCLYQIYVAITMMTVKSFRYCLLGIKVFLAPAASTSALLWVLPVSDLPLTSEFTFGYCCQQNDKVEHCSFP